MTTQSHEFRTFHEAHQIQRRQQYVELMKSQSVKKGLVRIAAISMWTA